MAFREVRVFEVREVLRLWLAGEGFRSVERLSQVDRKTVRRYVTAAERLGLVRDGGDDQLSDVFVGMVVEAVRPHRSDGHGEAWRLLAAHHDEIAGWVDGRSDGGEDPRAAGAPRRGGAVAHGAALRAGGVRPQPGSGSDGAGRGWRAGRRVAGRLRSDGVPRRPGDGPAAGGAGVDLHRLLLAALLRVVDVPPDHRGRDRRVRSGVGVLRRRVRAR